jgi:hypothetical protein
MKRDDSQEHRAEADRLAKLPKAEQHAIIAWQRNIAKDSRVKKADRKLAGDRAKALEKRLKKKRQ